MDALRETWHTLFCPKGGITGNYATVRHEVEGGIVQLCEIELYGELLLQ